MCSSPPNNKWGGILFVWGLWHSIGSYYTEIGDLNAILCMKQWQVVLFPLFLTSLMYAGSLMLLVNNWMEHRDQDRRPLLGCIKSTLLRFPSQMSSVASDVYSGGL
ncbi:hypothetical protein F3Y22_tig00111817pilonHSYRG00027 [Hibiscus syriacus]|uniref:Uncharacterized protein n=1 Tax=Hibiscus syriacus TaxID=106335 RepID=A0A6A2XCU8_HIBSY|nr:hypothetical protein F3Y22_tig00111817pilonHSYRG00027 [Hibiscus syriacus]